MVKCDACDKVINKRSPGLECSKCGKVVHANLGCSGLPPKQIAVLQSSESIEWTCKECSQMTPRRKTSFITLEEEEEEEIEVGQSQISGSIDVKKFLRDISAELKKIVRKEMETVKETLNSFGKKFEEFGDKIEVLTHRITDVEKKQTFLLNKNKYLETKVSSLEIQMRKFEQMELDKRVEITGIPKLLKEDIKLIANNVAKLLNLDEGKIKSVKRIEGRSGKDGQLQVELGDSELAASWAQAYKKETTPILAENVMPRIQNEPLKTKVIVRRALSKSNKSLLWNAQQKLRPKFKYVWFQTGKVLARQGDGDKPIAIWCEEDIAQLAG